ncbi:MAG: dihydropteroate synthase [Sulfuricellaceae bacterium]
MGIVNVTPDSFSDGGRQDTASSVAHALRLIDEGADILDIGGESTRPGALPVPLDEELRRVIPVVEALSGENIPLSVDTCKPAVMVAAIAAGATMINDINALQAEGALQAVANSTVAVCLMHKLGTPQTMQQAPHYEDAVAEIIAYLQARIAAAEAAGIERKRLVIDPGFGFGKTLEHNIALLRHLGRFRELGAPVLAGLSNKSMLGALTGLPVEERLIPSVAAAVIAALNGASILRVHDVKATRQALQVVNAVLS